MSNKKIVEIFFPVSSIFISLTLPSRCILAANGVPDVFLVNQENEAFPSRAHINLEALMFLAFQNEPKRPIQEILSSCNLG